MNWYIDLTCGMINVDCKWLLFAFPSIALPLYGFGFASCYKSDVNLVNNSIIVVGFMGLAGANINFVKNDVIAVGKFVLTGSSIKFVNRSVDVRGEKALSGAKVYDCAKALDANVSHFCFG